MLSDTYDIMLVTDRAGTFVGKSVFFSSPDSLGKKRNIYFINLYIYSTHSLFLVLLQYEYLFPVFSST